MSEVEVARVIAATPEELYDIVSDLPAMGDLSPENTGGTWADGATGPAVGAKLRGKNRRGWRRWPTTATVLEAERGRAFSFRVDVGPMKIARWGYRFEPVEGGTRVTETWDDPRDWLARFVGLVVSGVSDRATHNRGTMEVTLANLANAVEESTKT